jgi:hypothetical protein
VNPGVYWWLSRDIAEKSHVVWRCRQKIKHNGIDILSIKIDWCTEIDVPLSNKNLKEGIMDLFCKMKNPNIRKVLFLRKTRILIF